LNKGLLGDLFLGITVTVKEGELVGFLEIGSAEEAGSEEGAADVGTAGEGKPKMVVVSVVVERVGFEDGFDEGLAEGLTEGLTVGFIEGDNVGGKVEIGLVEGRLVGFEEGLNDIEGFVVTVGFEVKGAIKGRKAGDVEGISGNSVGISVGT
jgi:hypothetical protein